MGKAVRILQIVDCRSAADGIARELDRAGYHADCKRVDDAAGLRAAFADAPWDAIISDSNLAHFSAREALAILQENGLDMPFIVVSDAVGEEAVVAMMKSGAHDFVVKSNLSQLPAALEREMSEARARNERRRSEAAMRESEERLSLAVDAIQLGWFDHDLSASRIVCSACARRHLGFDLTSDVTYEDFIGAVHPEDRERLERAMRKALRRDAGGELAVEYRVRDAHDGQPRWIGAWGRALFDERGTPVRFVGITLDVSERKRLEEQFRQSQKLESIGRLAGGVAHDFNNLLTVITGYAHMGLTGLDPRHPLHDVLEEISAASSRATELTRQLLTFSRRHANTPSRIALNDLVRNFEKMLRRLIGEEIELALSLDPGAGVIEADPGEIEQVIMNLAINAKDAMPAGGRMLIETVPLVVDEQFAAMHVSTVPGRYIVLMISDTGTGMSADVQAHLFEPFFTTKEQGKGTGLGLPTVYGIVRQCRGSIWVYTEPGRGTSFKILFPAVEAAATEPAGRVTAAPATGHETILLAEDESGVRKYVRQILEIHGYKVLDAPNGREALRLASENGDHIDLLLTDVVMPDIGGPDLAGEMTRLRPEVRVLYMSGYSDRVWSDTEVAVRCIQKPFTAASLLNQVRAALD